MGDNRPPVYWEGDTLIIRTSAIGSSCMWELVAAGQGYEMSPVPDNLQRAFDQGNYYEPIIIGMLRDEGYEVWGEQEEGHLDISPNIRIRYHPDGFIYRDAARTLEVKALSDVLWQKAARSSVGNVIDEYPWQLSVMMHANGGPAVWVAFNKGNADGSECPDKGRLIYEKVDTPPISLDAIVHKAKLIYDLVNGPDIMQSGRPCDDPTHYPCRYLHMRPEPETLTYSISSADGSGPVPSTESGSDPASTPAPAEDSPTSAIIKSPLTIEDDDTKAEIDRLTREYLLFKGQADEAKQRQDAARDRLIELSQNHNKLVTDKWVIPVVEGSNTTPDWASMPQELKEEVNKYKKTTKYRFLRGIKPLD